MPEPDPLIPPEEPGIELLPVPGLVLELKLGRDEDPGLLDDCEPEL